MNKLIVTLAFLLPLAAMAQTSPIDKLFDKYANKKGFTTVNISGKLLSFASQMDTGDEEAAKMMSELKGIRVLSVEDHELNKNIDFYKELDDLGFFKNNEYESLMDVTEDNQVVRFLVRSGEGKKYSELLLIVGGEDNALISIRGSIDPANIGKITKNINVGVNSKDLDIDVK